MLCHRSSPLDGRRETAGFRSLLTGAALRARRTGRGIEGDGWTILTPERSESYCGRSPSSPDRCRAPSSAHRSEHRGEWLNHVYSRVVGERLRLLPTLSWSAPRSAHGSEHIREWFNHLYSRAVGERLRLLCAPPWLAPQTSRASDGGFTA